MAQQKKELGGKKLSLPVKIVIILFAIIMALSMMLPSLAPFFAGNNAEQEEEKTEETQGGESEETEAEGTTEEGDASETKDEGTTEEGDASETKDEGDDTSETKAEGDDAKAEGEDAKAEDEGDDKAAEDAERAAIPNNDSLKSNYDTYRPQTKRFEKKLESDPDNLAALLNAGRLYMTWGYTADYASVSDEEHAYAHTLVNKAIEYFDRYLALNDSKSVRVDRALCDYYLDETESAISKLEEFGKEEPDYPLIWANLGMLYELMGETEKANESYKTAAKLDPDDEYGAKTYANGRLIELNSDVNGPGDAGEADANSLKSDEESPEPGLTATLAQDTGVGF